MMAEALDRRFSIVSQHNQELVLDVKRNNVAPGAKIFLWYRKKHLQARNQLFYVDYKLDRIRSVLNDFCLDIQMSDKKILVLQPYQASSKTQQWDMRGGYIRNVTTKDMIGVPITAVKGMDVIFSIYANEKQEWIAENSPPCYFYLQSQHNRKRLDVCQKKTEPGTPVIVWHRDLLHRSKDNQLWFENVDGYLCTKLNNYVIDIEDGSTKAIISPPDPENPWQKWTFSDGFVFNLVNGTHVLAIDENDTDVVTCEKNPDSPRQKWSLKYA